MAAKEVDMSLMTQVMREEEMRRVKEETKMENNNEEDGDNMYQEDNNENANNYDNEYDGSVEREDWEKYFAPVGRAPVERE